jgi:hypothetical protein
VSVRRVLVATDHECPRAALEHALAFAGSAGEVVLASVLVVPHAQPLDAGLDRAVAAACAVLDQGERAAAGAAVFDTRLLRARSFAEGVLEATEVEPYDAVVLEVSRGGLRNGMRAQVETLMEKIATAVVLVRPAGVEH